MYMFYIALFLSTLYLVNYVFSVALHTLQCNTYTVCMYYVCPKKSAETTPTTFVFSHIFEKACRTTRTRDLAALLYTVTVHTFHIYCTGWLTTSTGILEVGH